MPGKPVPDIGLHYSVVVHFDRTYASRIGIRVFGVTKRRNDGRHRPETHWLELYSTEMVPGREFAGRLEDLTAAVSRAIGSALWWQETMSLEGPSGASPLPEDG